METKIKNSFKAVEFMRQVRNDLSDLYHSDKARYRDELEKSMANFLAERKKPAASNASPELGLDQEANLHNKQK